MFFGSDFNKRVMRASNCRNLSQFFAHIDGIRQCGDRYRSRDNSLELILDAYRTLATAYLHIFSPEWYKQYNFIYQNIDSVSSRPDIFNTHMIETVEMFHRTLKPTLLSTSQIFNLKFINMPYNAQLPDLLDSVLAKNTASNELNTLLNENPFHVLQNVHFHYANKTHTCCVLKYIYNLPDYKESNPNSSDDKACAPSYLVIASNLSDVCMGIAFKAIVFDILTDMTNKVAEYKTNNSIDLTTEMEIWQDLFMDMLVRSSPSSTPLDTAPYIARFEAILTEKMWCINKCAVLEDLKAVVDSPIKSRDECERTLQNLHDSIARYESELIKLYNNIDRVSIDMYKSDKAEKSLKIIAPELEHLVNENILVDVEKFKTRSNNIYYLNVVSLKFNVPIKLWEKDEAQCYITYRKNTNKDKDVKVNFGIKLLEAIFLDKKIVMYNTCKVNWDFMSGSVSNDNRSSTYSVDFRYMAHMHINRFNCFGNNARSIIKGIKEYDYKSALAYTMQAITQYNFGDSTVMGNVFKALYPNDSDNWLGNHDKKFLEYNGAFYSPQDLYDNYYNQETGELTLFDTAPSETQTTTASLSNV